MRRLLSLLLLLAFTIPAMAALVLGSERYASPVAAGPTPGRDYPLAVATDGTDFLVVWDNDEFLDPAVYVAKVTADGVVSPTPSMRLATGTFVSASLAWTGESYLLMRYAHGTGMMVSRLDRDGLYLAAPHLVSVKHTAVHALTWNGQNAVALVSDAESLMVLVMDARGSFVRETRVSGVKITGDARLLAAGGGFVAVWVENQRIGSGVVRAMPVSAEGVAGTPLTIGTTNTPGAWLDAATDGERVGIAYTMYPAGANSPGQPLERVTLDARTFAVTRHAPLQAKTSPEVVTTPDGFVAAVIAQNGDAATLESIPFASAEKRANGLDGSPANRLLTASNGRNVLAVWTRGYIAGAIFDATLAHKERDVFPISTKIIAQSRPELAPAGDIALLTWIEATADGGNLMATRINRFGNALTAPVLIASGEWIETGHSAIFAGNVWIVSWQQRSSQPWPQTFLRRVGLDGNPLDEEPLDFGVGGPFAFASNGDFTVGVRINAHGVNVRSFSRDGEPLDERPAIATTEFGAHAMVATNGREFLVAWVGATSGKYRLAGRRIGVMGTFIDAAPIAIDLAPNATWRPDVGSDGEDYFVAYQRTGAEILMKRIDRTGVLVGTTAGASGTVIAKGVDPRFALLGTRLFLSHLASTGGHELRLTAIDDKSTVEVAQSGGWIHHAIASRGNALWIAYDRVVPELFNVPRVFVRTLDDDTPGKRRAARK